MGAYLVSGLHALLGVDSDLEILRTHPIVFGFGFRVWGLGFRV